MRFINWWNPLRKYIIVILLCCHSSDTSLNKKSFKVFTSALEAYEKRYRLNRLQIFENLFTVLQGGKLLWCCNQRYTKQDKSSSVHDNITHSDCQYCIKDTFTILLGFTLLPKMFVHLGYNYLRVLHLYKLPFDDT